MVTPLHAMTFDISSLSRTLLHMLTGYPPGHAAYRAVECGRELREELERDSKRKNRADCCAAFACYDPKPANDSEQAGRRRTVQLDKLSVDACDTYSLPLHGQTRRCAPPSPKSEREKSCRSGNNSSDGLTAFVHVIGTW